ncbi:RNA polymerase sigma-70 factor (ECF subfamily) [Winogradskyella wandonensis]|uniref:RNA polymerase sigma-70 factor (ECF subfamily) n=1 Tax=Winogradskyella wandonensis TaxID=1442586 RepID=A0A4R1KVA6_9FLAO|nr:RNA polymerase sigma factor [Winogradskyella wandonensis]TCK69084.1 RNA polymerase sigma-70 factor (ECF subfamily) [Winogradskyella wandonensis]
MLSTNQDIEQLLELCCKGHQKSQIEIYNRYYKAMYNTSLRIVRDSYKAEDVMQESFLTAFEKLNTLKDKTMFGSWLKRIVINNSIAEYNRLTKENNVDLETVLYKVENTNGIEENDSKNEKVKHILDSIKQLKSNYSLGLTLHLIEGYDYEEISEIMNISYANCRTLISRAKESLRQKLSVSA